MGAMCATPGALPLWSVPMCKASQMNGQGIARSSPLLEFPLAFRPGDASTTAASRSMMVTAETMLPFPKGVCALRAGQSFGALGGDSAGSALGAISHQIWEQSIKFVYAEKVLLPLAHMVAAVFVERDGPRVLFMTGAASRGLLIHHLMEVPMSVGNVTKLGLVPGQMGLP